MNLRGANFMVKPVLAGAFLLALLVWMIGPLLVKQSARSTPDLYTLTPVQFTDLPGWSAQNPQEALHAFLLSCEPWQRLPASSSINRLPGGEGFAGTVSDWLPLCEKAATLDRTADDDRARHFFEDNFSLWRMTYRQQGGKGHWQNTDEGLFTAYYEPVYEASHQKTEKFSAAVYARPADLIDVDLGAFRQALSGQSLSGRLDGSSLVPYDTHGAIAKNGVAAPILGWMDPNDLLFLQIQGSGKLHFPEGVTRIGYAGKNGHPYTAIGRVLVDRNIMPLEEISMQSIKAWLEQAPALEAAALRHANESYVFFRALNDLPDPALGPIGAGGVQLTPGRSLAVDRKFYAMGLPVFVELKEEEGAASFSQLMITQDTGGAIKGPVRGDLFLGSGVEAGEQAGQFRREGTITLLLPTWINPNGETGHAP